MAKYAALGRYLHETGKDTVGISFAEIERILGVALPASARRHRAWWSNNPENNVATGEWLAAGYQTEQVDIRREKVVFRRSLAPAQVAEALAPVWNEKRTTMKTKKPIKDPLFGGSEEHPLFGVLKGMVYIPPGVDLTEPAEPDWEEIWLKKWDERLAEPGWEQFRPKNE